MLFKETNFPYFILLLLFLLIFILGQTAWIYFVYFIFVLMLLLKRDSFDFKKSGFYKKPLFFINLLLFFLVSNLIVSKNIFLSFDKFNSLVFIILFFLSIIFFAKDKFNEEDVFFGFNTIVLSLSFLVILLMIFPTWGNLVPGMNLIFSTYGHNHFVAFLILVIPLVFYQYISLGNKYLFYFLIFLFLLAIFSFGRVALAIILFQLAIIIFVNKKTLVKKTIRKFKLIFFISFFALTLSIVFNIFIDSNEAFLCKTRFSKQLCKPVIDDGRSLYIKNFYKVFKEDPVRGVSLGNYSSYVRKYFRSQEPISIYVHNDFLQFIVEFGLFQTIFYTSVFFAFIFSLKTSKKDPGKDLLFYIKVSLLGIVVNSFFDFDMQFVAILLNIFFLIAVSLKIKEKRVGKLTANRNYKLSKIIFFFLAIYLFLLSSIYFLSRVFIKISREDLAYKIAPYFRENQKNYFNACELLDFSIFVQNNSFNYRFFNSKCYINASNEEKLNFITEFLSFSGEAELPFLLSELDFFVEAENYDLAVDFSLKLLDRIIYIENDLLISIDYSYKEKLANIVLKLADISYEKGDSVLTSDLYAKLAYLIENLPKDSELGLIISPWKNDDSKLFLNLSLIKYDFFGKQQEQFKDKVFLSGVYFLNRSEKDLRFLAENIINNDYHFSAMFFNQLATELLNKTELLIENGDFDTAYNMSQSFYQLYDVFSKNENLQKEYWPDSKFFELYMFWSTLINSGEEVFDKESNSLLIDQRKSFWLD